MQLRTNYETFVVAIYSRKIRAYFNYFAHALLFENFRIHVHPASSKIRSSVSQWLFHSNQLHSCAPTRALKFSSPSTPSYLITRATTLKPKSVLAVCRAPQFTTILTLNSQPIIIPFVVRPRNTSLKAKCKAHSYSNSKYGSPKGTGTPASTTEQHSGRLWRVYIPQGVIEERRGLCLPQVN